MSLRIADSVWVATALLHNQNPQRDGFSGAEIREQAARLFAPHSLPAGVNPHIYGHCVANARPSSGRYRMLHRNADGTLRLYRSRDPFHPLRAKGRTTPRDEDLPEQYRWLAGWYRSEYNSETAVTRLEDDPLMRLSGLGKEIWQSLGGGDAVIRWLRGDEPAPAPWEGVPPEQGPAREVMGHAAPAAHRGAKPSGSDFGDVWAQIRKHKGDVFRTKTGLPFTYQLAGNGAVCIRRGEREINRQLPRGDFEKAWQRMPLSTTREIQDLQGPSYLFAILTDPRVAA